MELFFGNPSAENIIVLDEVESNHLINVKRSKKGDIIHVTDGEGNLFTTEISNIDKHNCSLSILEIKTTPRKLFRLHVAVAPTKNIDRIEWFLEKATETGIDEISFLQCRHSERKEIKMERLNRVVVSSIKQSLKTFLPKLNPMIDFKTFVSKDLQGEKLIFSTGAIENIKDNYRSGKSLIALIGPEGDFHDDELKLATENGYLPTSLGESRLRTETAAITVCTLFNFINSQ